MKPGRGGKLWALLRRIAQDDFAATLIFGAAFVAFLLFIRWLLFNS